MAAQAREVDQRLQRHKDQNQQLTLSMEVLAEIAQALEQNGETAKVRRRCPSRPCPSPRADPRQQVGEAEALLHSLLDLESHVTQHITALGETKQAIGQGALAYRFDEDGQTQAEAAAIDLAADFKKTVTALAAAVPQEPAVRYRKHPKYLEFKRKVWDVSHPGEPMPDEADEELLVMRPRGETHLDLLCPITRTLLKDPVKKYVSLMVE